MMQTIAIPTSIAIADDVGLGDIGVKEGFLSPIAASIR